MRHRLGWLRRAQRLRVPGDDVLHPDTFGPTVLWIALGSWALLERGRTGERALLGWASLNAVGGTLSVLPLGFLPFHPAQTLSHYDVHLVYLAAQVPLIAVLIRSLTSEALA